MVKFNAVTIVHYSFSISPPVVYTSVGMWKQKRHLITKFLLTVASQLNIEERIKMIARLEYHICVIPG